LYLFNNNFNETREIHGYSRQEIGEIKTKISNLLADNSESQEIEEFLKSKLKVSFKLKIFNLIRNI